jgi:hypothetical protein
MVKWVLNHCFHHSGGCHFHHSCHWELMTSLDLVFVGALQLVGSIHLGYPAEIVVVAVDPFV